MVAKPVAYVDIGISDAKAFWRLIVLPDVGDFKSNPADARFGLHVAEALWHVHEWLWHDQNPHSDTRAAEYKSFQRELFVKCPELSWMRDVAETAKHRGLSRPGIEVERIALKLGRGGSGGYNSSGGGYRVGAVAYGSGTPQRAIEALSGHGPDRWLDEVVDTVVAFWTVNYFAEAA
jgi:hypothetical protein